MQETQEPRESQETQEPEEFQEIKAERPKASLKVSKHNTEHLLAQSTDCTRVVQCMDCLCKPQIHAFSSAFHVDCLDPQFALNILLFKR